MPPLPPVYFWCRATPLPFDFLSLMPVYGLTFIDASFEYAARRRHAISLMPYGLRHLAPPFLFIFTPPGCHYLFDFLSFHLCWLRHFVILITVSDYAVDAIFADVVWCWHCRFFRWLTLSLFSLTLASRHFLFILMMPVSTPMRQQNIATPLLMPRLTFHASLLLRRHWWRLMPLMLEPFINITIYAIDFITLRLDYRWYFHCLLFIIWYFAATWLRLLFDWLRHFWLLVSLGWPIPLSFFIFLPFYVITPFSSYHYIVTLFTSFRWYYFITMSLFSATLSYAIFAISFRHFRHFAADADAIILNIFFAMPTSFVTWPLSIMSLLSFHITNIFINNTDNNTHCHLLSSISIRGRLIFHLLFCVHQLI